MFRKLLAMLWHVPGRICTSALKAARITLWWRFGATLTITALLVLVIWINWKGPWPREAWLTQLNWNGWLAILLVVALVICIAGLFERQVVLEADRNGFRMRSAEDRDDDEPERPHIPTGLPGGDGELPPGERVR